MRSLAFPELVDSADDPPGSVRGSLPGSGEMGDSGHCVFSKDPRSDVPYISGCMPRMLREHGVRPGHEE